jgi:hypothetical protein
MIVGVRECVCVCVCVLIFLQFHDTPHVHVVGVWHGDGRGECVSTPPFQYCNELHVSDGRVHAV